MNLFSFARRTTALLLLSASVPLLAAPAGALDPTFDDDGKQTIAFDLGGTPGSNDDYSAAMVMAPGGRMYIAGYPRSSPSRTAIGVTRLLADGTLDQTYGDQGRVVHDIVAGSQYVMDTALQSDGKLLLAGHLRAEGPDPQLTRMFACRLLSDGQRDASFGEEVTPGCRIFSFATESHDTAMAVLPQDDGRIVLAGYRYYLGLPPGSPLGATLLRIHADGSDDDSFGSDGHITLGGFHTISGFSAVTQLPEGDLVAVGSTYNSMNFDQPNDRDLLLFRVNSKDGSPVESFGSGGIKVIPVDVGLTSARRDDLAQSVHGLIDGSLLVTGQVKTDHTPAEDRLSYRPFALKLQQNGELDLDFGGGLRVYGPCPTFLFECSVEAQDAVVLPDGRFMIAGTYRYADDPVSGWNSADFFAMRLLPNGDLDTDFGPNQVGQEATAIVDFALLAPEPSADTVAAVLLDGERVLLAGSAAVPPAAIAFSQTHDFAIARLDHGLDVTFTVTPAVDANGQLEPSASQQVGHSDHVEFEITPAPGYRIESISGCEGAPYGNVYSTGAIVGDCTVTATFVLKPPQLFEDSFEP